VNCYHFLVDIIGARLRLADELGLFPNAPILIGRRVFEEQRNCREAIRLMEIPEDQIVIEDDRPGSAWWARSERLYFEIHHKEAKRASTTSSGCFACRTAIVPPPDAYS
jgi:hypothetical protein